MDLEQGLRDLGGHLDHPSGEQIVPRMRARIASPAEPPVVRAHRSRRRRVATVVASVAAVLVIALAIPTTRTAIADVLGLASESGGAGRSAAHEPGSSATTTTTTPTPTTPSTTAPAVASLPLETARTVVDFPIRVPGGVDSPPKVSVDHRVPGGLVALEYPTFTVVEVASPRDVASNLADMVTPESDVHFMSVRGRPGMWITGTHSDIAYLDRDGSVRRGAVRPTGHVLLWEEDGVTYRVEGFDDEAAAAQMATSMA